MRRIKISPFWIFVLFLFACNQQPDKKSNVDMNSSISKTDTAAIAIIKKAYIYGLPMILMDLTKRQMTNPAAGSMYTPVNQFRHNSDFPDASFKTVVRPNADTYYSIAWLDLTTEPVILSVPDTKGRYYMMPMMDAYSNVFASPGTRTSGNNAGNYLISGPQWTGTLPVGMKEIKSPTNTVWMIGRTQVNGKEDGKKNVVPLQKKYTLTVLSSWDKSIAPTNAKVAAEDLPKGDPNTIVKEMPIQEFFNYINKLLAKNPAPASDNNLIEQFARLGIGSGKQFDISTFSESDQSVINNIPTEIFSVFENEKKQTGGLVNGWNLGRKVIGTYGTDYLSRASVAYFGLGANLKEDAVYPSCYFDSEGQLLNGAHQYVLHFEKDKTPPANAFWSLTMYDPEGFFVENKLKRYTLGDRSNLKKNADGSIDIFLQKDNPGKEKEKNWLPAASGDFNLIIRIYWPKIEKISENWELPPVKKVQ